MSGADKKKPIVWSVAGSDSGGGAGLQADLKAFETFDVHGCTAVAALTAQNSIAVRAIEPVSEAMLDAQLAALAEDMPPAAITTGMLGSVANLRVVVRWVDRLRQKNPAMTLVVDPVLRATTGASFAGDELVAAYRNELLPRASLVTPNRREAAALLGLSSLNDDADIEHAARALRELGCQAVAITGGDESGAHSLDYVCAPWAEGWLRLPRIGTPHSHGTGCVFASSAAAAMARGFVSVEAVVLAKMATTHALRNGYAAGEGAGPVRPQEGFALRIENLPEMSLPAASQAAGSRFADLPPFAALTDDKLGLYAIVDSAAWIERVLAAGVRTVQLRIKDPRQSNLREEIRASVAAARKVDAQLFINDHWQVAIEEGAYGVHLGQEDLATADLAAIQRAGLRLGLSTHAYWEVCRAWSLKPSYIACGPIHPTAAKAMPWIPQGNGNLAYWCKLLSTPVVAIAGMDAARATEAARRGAAGVAVISAITAAPSPEAAIDTLREALRVAANSPVPAAAHWPKPTLSAQG
ncbi:MAG: bifunctional hydroxymethylpyrimidine kinase/phosphomethylpyrimidine kinase [Pseudomonadota bacterium]